MPGCLTGQATGLWGELCALKTVVAEPRGAGDDFDSVMRQYYGAVASGAGGLFLAVCRGKVSPHIYLPCARNIYPALWLNYLPTAMVMDLKHPHYS